MAEKDFNFFYSELLKTQSNWFVFQGLHFHPFTQKNVNKICTFLCMYVCMYVCIYLFIYVSMYVCYLFLYLCIFVCIY